MVGSFIQHPDRYRDAGEERHGARFAAKLVAFDLVNDLALLEASLPAPALQLAADPGQPGAPLIAFGNPEGLGLSLVEGVFNGFAEKGFVDRMLLSMPLNSGMSGGPILERAQRGGGHQRRRLLARQLALLRRPGDRRARASPGPAGGDDARRPLRAEVEPAARGVGATRLHARRRAAPAGERARLMAVGGALVPRPPDAFECWNQTQREAREQIRKTSFNCNLQFTPSLEEVGEVASLEVLVEHFRRARAGYGFYGGLTSTLPSTSGSRRAPPDNGVLSPPECHADRVRTEHLVWKVNACSYAYVQPSRHGLLRPDRHQRLAAPRGRVRGPAWEGRGRGDVPVLEPGPPPRTSGFASAS